jgi:hypothetical protein
MTRINLLVRRQGLSDDIPKILKAGCNARAVVPLNFNESIFDRAPCPAVLF